MARLDPAAALPQAPSTGVLLLSADPHLVAGVQRLAAAAGTPVRPVTDVGDAGRSWSTAAAVLVGADLTDELAALLLPHRAGVHVVVDGHALDPVFRSAVGLGAASVVELPGAGEELIELLSEAGDGPARPATTVAVVGASGGVGATLLAAAVAALAGRSAATMLVDLDPLGPGLHRVLGGEDQPGVTWHDLAGSAGRLGSRALAAALPARAGVGLLGWPDGPERPALDPAVVREVLAAGRRGHDWVVLDLPRHVDDVVTTAVARCDRVAVLVHPTVASVASAARVATGLGLLPETAGLVVRSGRGVWPAAAAAAVGLPLLAELGRDRRVDEHVQLGLGPVPTRRGELTRTAARLLARWRS